MLLMANIVGILSLSTFTLGLLLMVFNLTEESEFAYREASWFSDLDDLRMSRLYWGKKLFLDSVILMVVTMVMLIRLSILGIFF